MKFAFWRKDPNSGLSPEAFVRAAEFEAHVEKASREYEEIKPKASRSMDRVMADYEANHWGQLMLDTLEIR